MEKNNSVDRIVKKLLDHYYRDSYDWPGEQDPEVIDRERIERLHDQISGEFVSGGIKQPWADFISEGVVVGMYLGTEKRVAIDRAIDHFYFYMYKSGHLEDIIKNLSQDVAASIRNLVRDMDAFYKEKEEE